MLAIFLWVFNFQVENQLSPIKFTLEMNDLEKKRKKKETQTEKYTTPPLVSPSQVLIIVLVRPFSLSILYRVLSRQ